MQVVRGREMKEIVIYCIDRDDAASDLSVSVVTLYVLRLERCRIGQKVL